MTTKRSHGEGTVYKDGTTGRWVAEVSAGYDENGRRRRIRRKAATKSEARAKLREIQRQLDDGVPTGKAAMTVAELLRFYLDTVVASEDPSPNTVDNYRWAIDKHLAPALGRKRITNLTPEDVERFLVARRDDNNLSRQSLVRLRSVLASALREAQRRDWLHRNAAELARVPKSHSTTRRTLTIDQAAALLRTARGHRLEAAIFVGLTRGLRPGEVLGLTWADVELDADPPLLHVRRALKRENNKLRLGDTKTPKSRRTLVLPEISVAALTRHRARQAAERLANGDVWNDHDLVSATEIGTPIDPSNFRRAFKKLTRAAGLGDWAPYELRHSAVSLLSAAGVPVEQLADLAGHVDTRTLTAVYRHSATPAVDGGSDVADSVFGP